MMRHIIVVLTVALCIAGSPMDSDGAARKKPLTLKDLENLIGQVKARPAKKRAIRKKVPRKAVAPKRTAAKKAPVKPIPKPELKEMVEPGRGQPAPVKPVAKPEILPPPKSVEKPVEPPPAKAGPVNIPAPPDGAQACLDGLRSLGVEFSIPESLQKAGDCNVENPAQMTAISGKGERIEFPNKPVLRCSFAKKFAIWTVDVAAPIVREQLGSPLAAMPTGPGYECRGRNGDSSSKTSEHGFGNAVDIESVQTKDKKRAAVKDAASESNTNYRMLQALRLSGCGYFTTVLGPGSNEAHASHLHFDLAQRGKNNNYKICE